MKSNSSYHWYLIQAKPGQAERAQQELENQEFETYLPMINVEKVVKGKRVNRSEPLFPGYLFIYLSETESNWRPIRSTRGVARLVAFGNTPAIVPAGAVQAIRQQLRSSAPAEKYAKDDLVDLVKGPFSGLKAIFDQYDGDQRAYVLLELMGRWQRIAIELDQIESHR